MKYLVKIIIVLLTITLSACQQKKVDHIPHIKIGIIVPLEHPALNEIIAGFSAQLPQVYGEAVKLHILNAQGDLNLQRAIIEQMRDQDYDLIVPIATNVTQMTASIIHNKPIVSLAAQFSEIERQHLHPCNIVVVHDEISSKTLLEFLHATYPQIKKLSLIHSTSDKIYAEVKAAIAAGKVLGIEVKPVMVATLPELVSATQSLSSDIQGIFILKDNLIASGAPTITKVATAKHIPFFTSDEGSVTSGAHFALGVHEKQIGEEGAKLASAAIKGRSLCDIPNVELKTLTVFINKKSLQQASQSIDSIETAAKKLDYHIELVGEK